MYCLAYPILPLPLPTFLNATEVVRAGSLGGSCVWLFLCDARVKKPSGEHPMQLTHSLPKDAAYRPPRLRVLDESQRRDARSQRRRRERDARRERAAMATHACDGDTVTLRGGGAAAGCDAADVRRGDSTGGAGGGGAHLLSEEPLSCDRHRVLLHRFDDSAGMLSKLIEHTASGRAHEVGRLKTLAGDEEGSGGGGGGAGGGGEAAAPVYESSRMRNIDAAAMTSGADELARIRDSYVHTDLPVRLQQVADMFTEMQQNDALVVADGEEDTHELELLTFAKLFPTASPMRSRIDQLFNFDEMDYRDMPLPIHAVSNAKEALNGLMESVRRFVRIQRLQMQQHADRNLEAELRRSKEQLAKTIESLVEANSKVRLLEKQKAAQLTQVVAKVRSPVAAAAPLARSSSSASLAADEAAAREHEQRERLLNIQAQEAASEQRRHRPSLLARRSHDASSDASFDADERQHREAVAVPLPGKPLPPVPQTPDTDALVPASPAVMDSNASGPHFAAAGASAVAVGAPTTPTVLPGLPSLQLPCPVTVTATVATGTSDLDPDSPLKAVALMPAAAAPPETVSTATQSMSIPKPVLVAKETQVALVPPSVAAAPATPAQQQLSPAMSPQAGKGPPPSAAAASAERRASADPSSEAGASRRSGRGKRQKEQASVLLVESSQTLASPRDTADDDDEGHPPLAAPRPESVPQMLRYLLGADPEPLPGAAPLPPGAGSALDSEEQLQRNALAPMDYVGLRDRWEAMRNERLELQSKQQQQQQQSSRKPKKKPKLDAAARQRRKKHAERAERDVLLMVLRQANLEIYRRDLLAGVVSSAPAAASMLAASTSGDGTRRASAAQRRASAQRRTSAQQGGGGPSADDIWGLLGIPAVGDGGRVLVAETLAAGTLRDEGFASDVRACAEEQAEREADEAGEGAEGTRARGSSGAAATTMTTDVFPKARSQPVYLRRRDAPVVATVPESKRLAVKRLCCAVGPGEDVSVAEFAQPSLYQHADSHGEGARRLAAYLAASWTCETEKAETDFAMFVGFTIGNVHERALSQPAKVVGMLQCVVDGVAQTFLKVAGAQEDGDAVYRFEVVARKDDYVVVGAAKKDLSLALVTSLRCLHYCHRRFHTPTRLNLCVGATLASTRLLVDQVRAGEILVDTAVDFVPGECLKHFFLQHFDVPVPGSGGDVGSNGKEDGTDDEGEDDKETEDGVSRSGGSATEAPSVVSAYSLIDKRVGSKRDSLEAQAARHPLSKAGGGSLSDLVRIHERQTADITLVLRNADRQEAVPPPPDTPSTAVVVVDILGSAAAWRNVLLHYTKAEAAAAAAAAGSSAGPAAATTTAASVAAALQAAVDTAADAAAASFASSVDDELAAAGASVVCSGGAGEAAAAAPAGEAGAADAKPRYHKGPHAAFVECVTAFRRDVRQGLRAAHGWEVWCGCESFVCCFKTQKDALRFCTNVVGAYDWPLALFTDTPQLTGVVRVGAACSRAERVAARSDGVIAGAAVAAAALLCGASGGGEVLISQKMDGVAKKLSYETERTELHCVEGCPDFLASSLVQGCADRGVLEANKQRKLDYHVGPKVSSELLRIHQRVRVFSMMLSRLSKAGEEMPFTDEQFNQLWSKIINNKAPPESFDVDEFVELNPKVKPVDLLRIKSSMESASRFVIDSTSREARAVADSQIPMLSKSILGYLTRSIKAFYKIRKGDSHYLAKDAPGLNFEKVMAAMLSKTQASPEAVGVLEKESSTGKRLATLVARNRGKLNISGKLDKSPVAAAVATPASVSDVGLSPPPPSAAEALPTLWRRPGAEVAAPREHSASVAVAPPSEAAGTATPSLPDLDDKGLNGPGGVAAAPPVGSALLRKLAQAKRPAAVKGDPESSTPLSPPSRFPLADLSAPRLGGFGGSEPQGSPKKVDIGSLAAASMAAQRMVEKKETAKRPLATSSNVHSPVPMQLNLTTPMFPGFSSIASVKKRVREPLRKARQAAGRPAHSG